MPSSDQIDVASEPVAFVDDDAFRNETADSLLFMSSGSIYSDREATGEMPVDERGDFELLTDLPLLSTAGEQFLFRKMNFLKYLAEQERLKDTPAGYKKCRQLLDDSEAVRNHIAECNLRLVISIARRFTNTTCDFDELMSEGNEILLKAINKFDVSRGFRFSTYATHSVQRHYFRYTQRQQKRNTKEFRSSSELLNELPESELDPLIAEWIREEHRMTEVISRMAERLDERERVVIAGRFGLSNDGSVQTLRELAAELGLSKERVRQLQMSAVEKLRDFFDDVGRPTAVALASRS